MQTRSLGRTGWQISAVGFGAWGIGGGWGAKDDSEAKRSLHEYLDLGGNFIDTAYVYGDGHSEQLIAEVVSERRSNDPLYIASKVPPKTMQWDVPAGVTAKDNFPVDWVIECTERTLKNLKIDCLPLQQLHTWTDDYNEQLDWYEAFVKLREQGKIQAFGVSIGDYVPESGVRLAQSGRVDAIQVIYNIFEQKPENELFPAALANGVGILPRVPFEEGALTGKMTPGMTFDVEDWRKDYFTPERLVELAQHTNALQKFLTPETPTLPLLALRYCLHHPAVSSVLPGMRRLENVRANMTAADVELSAEMVEELHRHAWVHGWRYPWAS